jgi:predicted AlkP superfamily phosphohydrolase/phosphomutase
LRFAADAKERSTRKYFRLPHNQNAGAIRINLAGREPNGLVSAAEYDDVCAELIAQLREVTNVDTGRPLLADVGRCVKCAAARNATIYPTCC